MKEEQPKISIYNILEKRYPSNEYALMAEVRDKAGFSASRSGDFIAVNLWPSRGLTINGIELKSHRNDWLSEVKKPEKAENIFQYCDFFWLLTAHDEVAKLDEIPDAWGWLSIKGEKIFVKKEAPKLQPAQLTRHFVCAMLKRAVDKTDFVHIDNIQDKITEAKESAKTHREYERERAQKDLTELQKIISDFYQASGINLMNTRYQYNGNLHDLGKAVKMIADGGVDPIKKQLLDLEKSAQNVLTRISNALEAVKEKAV